MKNENAQFASESGHQLLSVPQIAQRLLCSERYVRQEIATGRLAEVNLGRLVRVTEAELQRYIAERTRGRFDAKQTAQDVLYGGKGK